MSWHEFTVALQKKILARMRSFGMTPVLPAFAGHIPKGFIDVHKVNYTEMHWIGLANERTFIDLRKYGNIWLFFQSAKVNLKF